MIDKDRWHDLDVHVYLYAKTFAQLQTTRIECSNRAEAAARLGMVAVLDDSYLDSIRLSEKQAGASLRKAMKLHPLRPWAQATKGVGDQTLGRLIGTIGNPCWRKDEDDNWIPRSLSSLTAYCGLHVVGGEAPKRTKGKQSNWNTQAKTILYLLAESQVKVRGAYRELYDDYRKIHDGDLHTVSCNRCKAAVGEPLKPAHQNARAMRIISKAILRDVWREARDLQFDDSELTLAA